MFFRSLKESVNWSVILYHFSTFFFQYIVALAIPVELDDRSMFVSINLEANYVLPSNSTNFTEEFFDKILFLDDAKDGIDQNIEESINSDSAREIHKRDLGFVSRKNLYQVIEGRLDMHELNGRECLMKLICDATTSDLMHANGFMGSLVEILLRYEKKLIHN